MWKKVIIIILILGILAGGFLFFQSKETASTEPQALEVKTLVVQPENLVTRVNADGSVVAKTEKEIKAPMGGLIEKVYIEEGEKVDHDQPLIKLDEQTLLQTLASAQLTSAEAEQSYQKIVQRYTAQDEENRLKLVEAEDNVTIARSSLHKEQISLEIQRSAAEKLVADTKEQIKKLEKDYADKKLLYEKDAIPRKDFEQARDALLDMEKELGVAEKDLQILVEETIPASLQLAQLKVVGAENQLKLIETSLESSRISKQEVAIAKLRLENALDNLAHIRDQLTKLVTNSPMSGAIVNLAVTEGDMVLEGATLGKVASVEEVIVEAWVDEIHINQVKLGQQVLVASDAFDLQLQGQIVTIAPVAIKMGNINRFKAEIELTACEGLLRPGMFVSTEIITNQRESVIAVPPLVIHGQEEKYLFVLKDGLAEKRRVELGLKNLTKVEVTGVEAGETVIIGPYPVLKTLESGTPVIDLEEQGQANI